VTPRNPRKQLADRLACKDWIFGGSWLTGSSVKILWAGLS